MTVQPVFISQKIGQDLKLREAKPSIVNHSALFTNLNVTCAMQVMLVSRAVIFTNLLKNTKTLLHQLASIFMTNILQLQRISQRTLAF